MSLRRVTDCTVWVLVSVVAACQGATDPSNDPNIQVFAEDSAISVGRSISVSLVRMSGANSGPVAGTVSWSSSTPAVATISPTGVVEALTEGATTISASSAGIQRTLVLQVVTTRALALGRGGTCLVRSDGRVYCWGGAGVLGPGGADSLPHRILGVPLSTISVGFGSACGLSLDSEVYCMGDGGTDFPGGGTWREALTHVVLPAKVQAISQGSGGISCAIAVTSQAYCWGIRTGSTNPSLVQGGVRFAQIGVGFGGAAGIAEDGRLYWWDETLVADTLMSDRRFTHISGEAFFCGITTNAETLCWNQRVDVRTLAGAPALVSVAHRPYNTLVLQGCGIALGGVGYCWGRNLQGEMGTGTVSAGEDNPPAAVNTSLRFTSIHPGGGFTCALATNKRPYCWGSNQNGELGDGTRVDRLTPTAVRVP